MSGPRICTSLAANTIEELLEKASTAMDLGSDLIELRLDFLETFSVSQIERFLGSYVKRAIATLRPVSEGGRFVGPENTRIRLLEELASLPFYLIDVEYKAISSNRKLHDSIKRSRRIISWHSLSGTPSIRTMHVIVRNVSIAGAYAKIVTVANSYEDNVRTLSLYRSRYAKRLIAFCMGDRGVASRFVSASLGSPIVYCSLPSEPVAEGQVSLSLMQEVLRGIRN
ncbi:MAG: type I 3-dehydroquinate dehydratase [Nitrososphaerota archaeon]|nr:type I 3-dehydroquinate dehydratase [Nitrososphaerota archaeon]